MDARGAAPRLEGRNRLVRGTRAGSCGEMDSGPAQELLEQMAMRAAGERNES